MDYSKAKIYQIWNTKDNELYIGATCQPLSKRMVEHRKATKHPKKKNNMLYQKMNEFGKSCFFIELILECPVENIEQLRKIEGAYIKQYGTLNMTIAGRNRQEWYEDNKEREDERIKQYNVENKEKILEQKKQYIIRNKEKVRTYQKEYYDKKKQEIIVCETCGHSYSRVMQSIHFKTKRHHKALNNITNNEDIISNNI